MCLHCLASTCPARHRVADRQLLDAGHTEHQTLTYTYLSTLDTDKKWIVIDISRCVLPAPRYLVALKHFDEVFAPFCIDERFVPDNFDICNRRGGGGGRGDGPKVAAAQEPGAGVMPHIQHTKLAHKLHSLHTVCNTLTTHSV